MKESRFPRLATIAAALFEQPISKTYLDLSIVFIFLAGFVIYGDSNLPAIAKHLVLVAMMLGIARLFNPMPMRWAWAGVVGLTSLLLVLDVAVLLV